MKRYSPLPILVFLCFSVVLGVDPTYDELAAQLPVTLTPDGEDQYFFFIVPVQKNDEPNVILQMAQAQSGYNNTNVSIATTFIDTIHRTVNVSTHDADLDMESVFKVPEEDSQPEFNFQVPVVVPLDFRFTYDPSNSSVVLPQCTVDSRTWKEKVISRIAEKLELEGQPSWDHSTLNGRIRRRKDGLASITLSHITTVEQLDSYTSVIEQTKYLASIRYHYVINDITELKASHVSLMAEAFDTYSLLLDCVNLAETAIEQFLADSNDTVDVDASEMRINTIKPSLIVTHVKFAAGLATAISLRDEENAVADDS